MKEDKKNNYEVRPTKELVDILEQNNIDVLTPDEEHFGIVDVFYINEETIILSKEGGLLGKGLKFNNKEDSRKMISSGEFPEEIESDNHFCRVNKDFIGDLNLATFKKYINTKTSYSVEPDSLSSIRDFISGEAFSKLKQKDEKLVFSISYILMNYLKENANYKLILVDRFGDYNTYSEPVLSKNEGNLPIMSLVEYVRRTPNFKALSFLLFQTFREKIEN